MPCKSKNIFFSWKLLVEGRNGQGRSKQIYIRIIFLIKNEDVMKCLPNLVIRKCLDVSFYFFLGKIMDYLNTSKNEEGGRG